MHGVRSQMGFSEDRDNRSSDSLGESERGEPTVAYVRS